MEQIAIVGAGDVPEKLNGYIRLPDIPDTAGPISGILAAMRWAPHASWLVAACDLPRLSLDALEWLLASRAPGVWATIPRLPESPGVEPLLAHYDSRARALLEDLAAGGVLRPGKITDSPSVISPAPPENLIPAWQNINSQG